jgi:hypothetical protein
MSAEAHSIIYWIIILIIIIVAIVVLLKVLGYLLAIGPIIGFDSEKILLNDWLRVS